MRLFDLSHRIFKGGVCRAFSIDAVRAAGIRGHSVCYACGSWSGVDCCAGAEWTESMANLAALDHDDPAARPSAAAHEHAGEGPR